VKIYFSIKYFTFVFTASRRMKLENAYRTRPRRTHTWTKEEIDKLCLMWIDMSPMTFHYTPSKICLQFIYWLKTTQHRAKTRPNRNAIMAKLYHCSKKGTPYMTVLHKTSMAEMQCLYEERYRSLYKRQQQHREEEYKKYPCYVSKGCTCRGDIWTCVESSLNLDSDDDW
jgi:hypothetical protein